MRPVKLDVVLSFHMETLLLLLASACVLYLLHRMVNFAVYAFQKHEAKPQPGRFTPVIEDHLLVLDDDDLDDCVLDPWNSQQHGYPSTRIAAQTQIRETP